MPKIGNLQRRGNSIILISLEIRCRQLKIISYVPNISAKKKKKVKDARIFSPQPDSGREAGIAGAQEKRKAQAFCLDF